MKMNSENIMLKNIAQNITGIKTFTPKYPDELEFKAMKLKGLLNGDDLIDVLNNQVSKKHFTILENMLFDKYVTLDPLDAIKILIPI